MREANPGYLSGLLLAARGEARCTIVTQPGATAAECTAAEELALALRQMTGAAFEVQDCGQEPPLPAIVVGPGPVAAALFPDLDLAVLGDEEFVVRTRPDALLLAGGRPRGTIYAVYRFLQDQLGVRWYAPWVTHIPRRPTILLPPADVRGKPAFEYRDPFWFLAFDAEWAARNGSNSHFSRLTQRHGGKVLYKGFVHTYYSLVPPEEHFELHPEWYSAIDGKRVHEHAQLCTTNRDLRELIVERVKEWLRESPEAQIVSLSQNDWFGPCECAECRAIDEREGSHAGSLIELVNYVAERIEPEFPHVAVDTLAYQYTRKAPKTVRPRPNVIVRLCTIECDFRQPLEGPTNSAFAQDNREWSKLTNRLYVWDYTTDFAFYMQPHPNWDVLGPNVRFFHRHGVRGLFEQGAYESFSSEMSELRAWVLAQLLWNPYQDDKALIDEFLDAYYGPLSAPYVRRYMALMLRASAGFHMGCFAPSSSPYLRFETLARAERLWELAESVALNDPDRLWRVRQGRLAVWFAFLTRWTSLRRECLRTGGTWPVPASRKELAERWIEVATGPGPAEWAPVSLVRERDTTPHQFVAMLGEDPPEPLAAATYRPARGVIEIQDDVALIYREPWESEACFDPKATDGVAARISGDHKHRSFAAQVRDFPTAARIGRWIVCLWARAEVSSEFPTDGIVFRAGVGVLNGGPDTVEVAVTASELSPDYRGYEIGAVDLNEALQIWVEPPGDERIRAVWVDRITLQRAP